MTEKKKDSVLIYHFCDSTSTQASSLHEFAKLAKRVIIQLTEIKIKRRLRQIVLTRLLNNIYNLLQPLRVLEGIEVLMKSLQSRRVPRIGRRLFGLSSRFS